MKYVKKITAFLLVFILIASLAACGRKETEQQPTDTEQPEISGKIEPIEVPEEKTEEPLPEAEAEKHESDETSENEPEEAEKKEDPEPEKVPEEEPEPEKKPEKETNQETEKNPEKENDFALGTVEGATYKNTYLGIGCSLDESWEIMSDEELLELNEVSADIFDNEQIRAAMQEADVFYDFYAQSADGMANINIVFEKLNPVAGIVMSEEWYVNTSMEGMEQALPSAGFSNVSIDKTLETFAGAERYGMKISGTVQGIAVYQRIIVLRKDDYAICIAISTFLEDNTDSVCSKFFKL